MTNPVSWRLALALALALCTLPVTATAQDNSGATANPGASSPPIVFSFVLRQEGDHILNPFGVSGRREVLQLQAGRNPHRGQFRRARLDHVGQDDWTSEGWYEIRGNIIQLYHSDASGSATGRVETGRYLENTICFNDPESGQLLAFSYLEPATATDPNLPPLDTIPNDAANLGASCAEQNKILP
jgi:hypothetical protein